MLVVVITVGSTSRPGLIDDPDLISVIERECEQMTASVEALPMYGTARQAQTIASQNVAVEDMLDDIRWSAVRLSRAIRRRTSGSLTGIGSSTAGSRMPPRSSTALAQLDVPNDDRGNESTCAWTTSSSAARPVRCPKRCSAPIPTTRHQMREAAQARAAAFLACLNARTLASESGSTTSATER